jgi:hypothetical protein
VVPLSFFLKLNGLVSIAREHGKPVLHISHGHDMHPVDRFTLFATAVDELLTENAGKVTDADRRELAELLTRGSKR